MKDTYLNIQTLLYYSSDDLGKLLSSINSLIINKTPVSFVFMDQSENEKEFKKVAKIINNTKLNSDNIRLILDKQPNFGFGKGHNEIYKKNKNLYKDFFILLNPDGLIPATFFKQIQKYLNQLENVNWGLLEIQQFPSEHPKYYNPKTLETNWASGASLIINKTAFEKVGMFDENIFMYGEDVDLSIRMRMNGYKLLHLPKAKFVHLTKDTDVTQESDFTRIHKQSSELYLRYKYARDMDVKKYISFIGKNDPHYKEIMTKYLDMKKKLKKKTPYRRFFCKENDYTNFRWTL